MRIGVSGVGRIGQLHAANLVATVGVTEVVLHDPAPGRAAKVAGCIGAGLSPQLAPRLSTGLATGLGAAPDLAPAVSIRAVESLDELLAAVDGVVVATPTPSHADVVHAALHVGVPVLCEKPLAGDVDTVREVATHAARVGVPLLVGFQRRFDPAIAELKRRIEAGEVGDVYAVRATAFDHEPPPADYIATSGGIFRDMFVHDLDAVPWLVGRRVTSVHATGSVLVDQAFAAAGDVDTAAITLVFEGGVIAQLVGGRKDGTGYDNRIDVFGERQTIAAGYDARTPFVSLEPGGHDPAGTAYTGFQERYTPAYRREAAVFLDVIAGRAKNPSPAVDSLVSLVLAQACEESLRTGRTVTIDPTSFSGAPST